ncbi:TMEM175 family protein [Furfurilactobacillus milii]|uniref:DUF1211 domain-containing protein n=1 Tax=Furfurilactobacillus milii TaxID=2888272 RepID=A0A6N9I605_9LACO|nr:TMEM175 family protein [Furfurilactobacillus milii]MYV17703.1 DUF1211 domain-containing protein [Furfurilactobacillus milii]
MNKARLEAFTDAVLAIILTIMILEFKTPKSLKFSAIFSQVPYLISYAIGYLFIGAAWYNHHFLFGKAKIITRHVFWANNLWLFGTSFLPVATAWVGEGIFARGPQAFYMLIYAIWTIAFVILAKQIIKANENHPAVVNSIKQLTLYRYLTYWPAVTVQVVLQILSLLFFPAGNLILITLQIITSAVFSNKESDKIIDS